MYLNLWMMARFVFRELALDLVEKEGVVHGRGREQDRLPSGRSSPDSVPISAEWHDPSVSGCVELRNTEEN